MPGAVLESAIRRRVLVALLAIGGLGVLPGHARVVDTGQAQCCSSIVPEMPPQTYYGATMIRAEDLQTAWQQRLATPDDPPASLEHLMQLLEEAESRGGPMSPDLVEPLSGLASVHFAENRSEEAIRALRRGIHLARLNDGLYSPTQTGLLEQLIAAYIRQGNFIEADKQQAYLFRVRTFNKRHDSEDMLQATLDYGHWSRTAYLGDLDRERYPRLVDLNDLYGDAIDELEESHGDNARELLPYLQGQVELSYLISVYPGEQETGFRGQMTQQGDFALPGEARLRFERLKDDYDVEFNFKNGLRALRRRESIVLADPASTPAERAAAHVAIGDWYQWYRKYATAIRIYEEAWEMMAGVEGGGDWLRQTVSQPLELPRDTVFDPGVMPLGTQNEAEIVLRFNVSRHGEAKDIVVLSERSDETQAAITRAYHYLRNLRFRPSMENGTVVRAEGIERRYHIRY